MNDKRLEEYIIDRDFILKNIENLSLIEIIDFCIRWKLPMPMPLFEYEEQVKGSLHKARLGIIKLTDTTEEELEELKQKSKEALDKLGWDYETI